MTAKNAYVAKMEAQLKELGAELSKLKAKAQQAVAQGRIDYNERLRASQTEYDSVSRKIEEIKNASEQHWEAMKAGVEGAWEHLKKSVDSMRN